MSSDYKIHFLIHCEILSAFWEYSFEVLNVFGSFLFIYILGQSYCNTFPWDVLCFQALSSIQIVFCKYFAPYRSSHSNSRLISYGMVEWCYDKSNVWKCICVRPWLLLKWPLVLRDLTLGTFIHSGKKDSEATY